ncbi:ABC transporter substrate-binding protein [Brachybacterium saurashtrense]|uniref:ABC transporter substrate-binding protein n=1 Tax=Brachybacterium saurashtrense TaxID=556288 RepID=A0A345YSM1_9MICO|nr:ABC transporter substrate-binding protein [Brachybacterium saurashtrense]AXK46923.1 ABC transporter substrate-binding protein [Brachybacterium saurashtrense]RRR22638.1 ABC transporter substrate-binding protein [Brachybacterium saurashtrense]
MRRRTLLSLAPAAALGGALAACGPAVTGEDPGDGAASGTVRVGHLPSSLFAPLYVADAKGFFADAGITVELTPLKSGQDGIPMLANDQLDVMIAGFSAGMFNALDQGLAFKVVGSMGISPGDPENSPTALEVSQELIDSSEVTTIADLAGRTIGVAGGAGATGSYLLAAMLEEDGLTLNDVEISNLSTPDQEPALTNGSIDAATPSAPFSTAMEEAGVASPLAVPAEGTTGTGVLYSETFLEAELAQPFFTALAQGSRELAADGEQSDEVYQILADTLGQEIEVLKSAPMYSYLPDLAPQPDQLEAMQSVWLESGQITYSEPLDVAGVVEARFAEGATA